MTKYRDLWETRLALCFEKDGIKFVKSIIMKIGSVAKAQSILKASQYFLQSTDDFDMKNHLLGFENGVFDFSKMIFRRIEKTDMITFSTKYDYTAKNNHQIQKQLNDFFTDIFTKKDVREYMILNMSQMLVRGQTSQLINFWTGVGQNGKGVLANLIKYLLGEYYTVAPSSM